MALPSMDAAYWRRRAAETRALAQEMTDNRARSGLLEAADAYEELARMAEANTIKPTEPRSS
jgi:hypothetical protein